MRKRLKYLLDTDTLSYAVNADWAKPEGEYHWVNRRLRIFQNESCLPSITVEEVIYGFERKNVGAKRKQRRDRWLQELTTVPYDDEAAKIAGMLRATLENNGNGIKEPDIRIAAIALRHNLVLVTNNEKHFERISNLRVINWAKTPISSEKFFWDYIERVVRDLYPLTGIVVAFLAYFLLFGASFTLEGDWIIPYFSKVMMLSVIAGMMLSLGQLTSVKICIYLKRLRLI